MNQDPVADAAVARAKLEDAVRERDAARAEIARLKAETAPLNIQLRAQEASFVQRAQGWAERLRRHHHIPAEKLAKPTIGSLEALLVEMLRYSGEPAPAPSPADVERAHERLKQLQEGAAQVAEAAAGTGPLFPAFAAQADDAPACFKLGCSLPAEGTGVLERDGLVPLCRRHGSRARAWTEY